LKLCMEAKADCPTCNYDPIRRESTDPYCDYCDGKGKIFTPTFYDIPSSVETTEDFQYEFSKAGRIMDGEILATIDIQEIDTVLDPTGKYNMDDKNDIKRFLDQYKYFEWKCAKYVLKSFQAGYLQGNFYEISMTLSLKD